MKPVPLSALTLATFSELLNASFGVRSDQSALVPLKLVSVTPRHSSAADARGVPESFSLVFSGPLDCFLPQRTYSFEQEQIGQFELFIVPIGQSPEGFQYEAIFNRVGMRG